MTEPQTPATPDHLAGGAPETDHPPVVRFAPSPTGMLHLGNARVAVLNALFARRYGGELILRMDDTDISRVRADFVQAIREDLAWLGLVWGREESQAARTEAYERAATRLKAEGRLYACYETAEDLEYKRRRQRARGLPPVYDRAGLALTEAEKAALEADGRRPHWRFKLLHEDVTWQDLARGACHYNGAHLSDPVLIREDGTMLYTLPSVVDDIDFGVTHVIRGEDHVVNTAVQIQLAEALGGTAPAWAHVPLVVGADGSPLSKREGALGLADLRADGVEPQAIVALMATLGSGHAGDPTIGIDGLAAIFRLDGFGRAQPRLDPKDLDRLTARVLHGLDYAAAKPRLVAMGADGGADFWEVVRPNLTRFAEAAVWHRICRGVVVPTVADEDRAFVAEAAALLPDDPWDDGTWKAWTGAVKAATGRKGRGLFMPLRQALTGMDHGPELANLLPLIGREKVLSRLAGETA